MSASPSAKPPSRRSTNPRLGRVVYEPQRNARGEPAIWVERLALDKLDALRASTESYSDAILQLVELDS